MDDFYAHQSPRVAPIFLALTGTIPACHLSSQWVRPFPSPLEPGDRQSEHPIARYGQSKSRVSDFSPFAATWKIPSFKDDRRKRQAFGRPSRKLWAETLGGGGGGGGGGGEGVGGR